MRIILAATDKRKKNAGRKRVNSTFTSLSFFFLMFILCAGVLTACISMHIFVPGTHRGQKMLDSPRTAVTDGCEPACGCCDSL
jgi:hypothetical protein